MSLPWERQKSWNYLEENIHATDLIYHQTHMVDAMSNIGLKTDVKKNSVSRVKFYKTKRVRFQDFRIYVQ